MNNYPQNPNGNLKLEGEKELLEACEEFQTVAEALNKEIPILCLSFKRSKECIADFCEILDSIDVRN
jgi:hypothetical protein